MHSYGPLSGTAFSWQTWFPPEPLFAPSLIPPQQFVQAGLRPGLGIDGFDNYCAVEVTLAVTRGQRAGHHHRAGRHAAIERLAARPVVDARALADEHAHREHAVLLDDHTLDHLGAGADEAVVLDDHRVAWDRLRRRRR